MSWVTHGLPLAYPWDAHGISMGCIGSSHGIATEYNFVTSMGYQCDADGRFLLKNGLPVGHPWATCGRPWDAHGLPMGYPRATRDDHGLLMGYDPWDAMGGPWDANGMPLGCQWATSRISCDSHRLPTRYLWVNCVMPMGCPWALPMKA